MSKYIKSKFERDRLKISLSITAFILVFITAIPLSIFMLYNDLQDSTNRQYAIMEYRAENIQEALTRRGSLKKIPSSFFDGFGYSGERILIDEHSDELVEKVVVLPAETRDIKEIDKQILSAFSPLLYRFINYETTGLYERAVNNLPMTVDENGKVIASSVYIFQVEGVDYQVLIDKDITSNISVPFDTFTSSLLFMMIWFTLLAVISILFFLRYIFKPLEKGLNSAAEQMDRVNFHLEIPDPKYGQEVSRVISIFNMLLKKYGDLVEDNANTMQDISHEVRTHLTAIKQSVDIIKMYGPDDPQLVLARMTTIESNITRATDIMTTILNLARLKQGSQLEVDEQYSAIYLLHSYLEFQAKRFPDFDLHSLCDIPEETEIAIERQHFFLAMNPLMENAARYSVDSSTILIQVEKGADNTVEFSVTNHGRVIDPKDIPYLFDRYYRGSNIGNVKAGSGLGLTITREVMNLYGGNIRVESSKKGKTKFTLIFPNAYQKM